MKDVARMVPLAKGGEGSLLKQAKDLMFCLANHQLKLVANGEPAETG